MLKELAEQTPELRRARRVRRLHRPHRRGRARRRRARRRCCRSTSASAARSAPGSRSRCGTATSARCSSTPTASTIRSRCELLLDRLDARRRHGDRQPVRRRRRRHLRGERDPPPGDEASCSGWCGVLVRQRFTDTSSGFRAFSRPMLEYFAATYPVEYMDSVEALVQACNAGFRVEEVPVNMRGRTGGAPSHPATSSSSTTTCAWSWCCSCRRRAAASGARRTARTATSDDDARWRA